MCKAIEDIRIASWKEGKKEGIKEGEKKVKLLVYATEDQRTRIKMTAAKLQMSMSQLILDSVLEQVSSIEALERREDRA